MKVFWQGLTTPSWTALMAMVATALACLIGASLSAGPTWLDAPEWLAAHHHDDDLFLRAQMRSFGTMKPGSVMLLGASGMREAITSEEGLSRELRARTGTHVQVWDLSTNGQTLSEAAVLVEELPEPVTLVLGVGMLNFLRPDSNVLESLNPSRLGIHNAAWEREVLRWGGQPRIATGVPFIDEFRVYGARLPKVPGKLVSGTVTRERHRYLGVRPNPNRPEAYDARLVQLQRWSGAHLDVLEDVVHQARAAGHRVVVFETPMNRNTWGTPEEARFFEGYKAVSKAMRSRGLQVVGLPPGTVSSDDFADPLHLNNSAAQERATSALADLLTR